MTVRRIAAAVLSLGLAVTAGAAQTLDATGTDQTGTDQTGTDQTGTDQTGTGQTGTGQTGTDQNGSGQNSTDQTGTGTAADGTAVDPNAPSTLPQVDAPPVRFVSAQGGVVRVLDKLTGVTTDLDLKPGAAQTAGHLGVVMDDCRYPADDPTSDSVAHLVITATGSDQPVFTGWMMASSPALSALDHPRYDVWVLTCDLPPEAKTVSASGSGG